MNTVVAQAVELLVLLASTVWATAEPLMPTFGNRARGVPALAVAGPYTNSMLLLPS